MAHVVLEAGYWGLDAGYAGCGGTPIPGVFVRVARKGLTRHGVRKSGKNRGSRLDVRGWKEAERHPHPGCFTERGCSCLIIKEMTFLATQKRLQAAEKQRGDNSASERPQGALALLASRAEARRLHEPDSKPKRRPEGDGFLQGLKPKLEPSRYVGAQAPTS